ncbi:MAG: hypothetical protein IT236_05695 [Bacteroidia bacterium]|nr:hypothetical protein [Bacteroidia bacterium]
MARLIVGHQRLLKGCTTLAENISGTSIAALPMLGIKTNCGNRKANE